MPSPNDFHITGFHCMYVGRWLLQRQTRAPPHSTGTRTHTLKMTCPPFPPSPPSGPARSTAHSDSMEMHPAPPAPAFTRALRQSAKLSAPRRSSHALAPFLERSGTDWRRRRSRDAGEVRRQRARISPGNPPCTFSADFDQRRRLLVTHQFLNCILFFFF